MCHDPAAEVVLLDSSLESIAAEEPLFGAAITDPSGRVERIVVVRQALAALTADERELLVMRFAEDCALEEIARRLRCRNAEAKERLQALCARLRALLADCR